MAKKKLTNPKLKTIIKNSGYTLPHGYDVKVSKKPKPKKK